MYWSTIGFLVLHSLLEFDLTHVHWVGDVIQPFHPPLPPTFPALNLSQQQSFPVSQLFTSGGQSIGASVSASVFLMNIQGWYPLGSPCSPGDSRLLQHHCSKAPILQRLFFFMVQLSHPYINIGKNNSFDYTELCWHCDISVFQYAV